MRAFICFCFVFCFSTITLLRTHVNPISSLLLLLLISLQYMIIFYIFCFGEKKKQPKELKKNLSGVDIIHRLDDYTISYLAAGCQCVWACACCCCSLPLSLFFRSGKENRRIESSHVTCLSACKHMLHPSNLSFALFVICFWSISPKSTCTLR